MTTTEYDRRWLQGNCCCLQYCMHVQYRDTGVPSCTSCSARSTSPKLTGRLRGCGACGSGFEKIDQSLGAGRLGQKVRGPHRERRSIPARPRSTRRRQTKRAGDGCARRAEMPLAKQVWSDPHRSEVWRCLRERAGGRTRRGAPAWSGGNTWALAARQAADFALCSGPRLRALDRSPTPPKPLLARPCLSLC